MYQLTPERNLKKQARCLLCWKGSDVCIKKRLKDYDVGTKQVKSPLSPLRKPKFKSPEHYEVLPRNILVWTENFQMDMKKVSPPIINKSAAAVYHY